MTRIGFVTQWYDPEQGSAAVPGAIARALTRRGDEVHVLTGFPNYPAGKLYPGYRMRPYQYELRDGVHVHRVPLAPSHDTRAASRIGNYGSFALSASLRPRVLRSVDAWLVYSSPATAALPAMVARSLMGRPYVLLVQDLWPQSVTASGFIQPGRSLRMAVAGLHRFCDAAYRNASAIAVTAPGMVEALCDRGVPASKITLVPNWVDERIFRPVPRDQAMAGQLGLDGFVVMYAGNLGRLQGLETAIAALDHLRDLPDVHLVMVGTGVDEASLRNMAAASGHRVTFLGQQPLDRMPALLALSDAQLVSLRDLPLFRTTLPSKVQASLAVGRPVIAAVAGDARNLIERSGAGITAVPEDPTALAAAIRIMHALTDGQRRTLGDRGRQYYLDHLGETVGSKALAGLLERAVSGRPAELEPAGAGR